MRVHREARLSDDGYRCELVPGLRSSGDAGALVDEIAFAAARLRVLAEHPPGLYAAAKEAGDLEQATWMCFLIAYLSPLQGEDPFRGIRAALEQADWRSGGLPALEEIPIGSRSSHEAARGVSTLEAYRRFAEHAGSQELAFIGQPEWAPERRFERVFERLALPGFGRSGRYEMLVVLGELGLYEVRPGTLHLIAAMGRTSTDPTALAAKRIFGIGDAMNLERRAVRFAEEIGVSVHTLDLALSNWGEGERVTLGFESDISDQEVHDRAGAALGL
jgi:hypothetical protein